MLSRRHKKEFQGEGAGRRKALRGSVLFEELKEEEEINMSKQKPCDHQGYFVVVNGTVEAKLCNEVSLVLKGFWVGGVVQMEEYLPSKCEALLVSFHPFNPQFSPPKKDFTLAVECRIHLREP